VPQVETGVGDQHSCGLSCQSRLRVACYPASEKRSLRLPMTEAPQDARGAKTMIAAPANAIPAPSTSQRSGLAPSTAHSHTSEAVM